MTLCCNFNLAARVCTLNIARIHIINIFHEWSAALQTNCNLGLLWVLAWHILKSDLELAPRFIVMTASSCVAVRVKVWVARSYRDATFQSTGCATVQSIILYDQK